MRIIEIQKTYTPQNYYNKISTEKKNWFGLYFFLSIKKNGIDRSLHWIPNFGKHSLKFLFRRFFIKLHANTLLLVCGFSFYSLRIFDHSKFFPYRILYKLICIDLFFVSHLFTIFLFPFHFLRIQKCCFQLTKDNNNWLYKCNERERRKKKN